MENPWHSPFQHRGFKCLRVTPKVGDFLSFVAFLRHEFEPCIGQHWWWEEVTDFEA